MSVRELKMRHHIRVWPGACGQRFLLQQRHLRSVTQYVSLIFHSHGLPTIRRGGFAGGDCRVDIKLVLEAP